MTTNPYSPPTARVADRQELEEAPAIWNPNAAANWSLVFSPALGAFLHMLNWQALGEPGKAASAKGWFIASLVMLGAYLVFGLVLSEGATQGVGLAYLLAWYFSAGREQARYVKDKFGRTYPRRGWAKPLLIGVLAIFGYVVLAFIVGVFLGLAKQV